MIKWLNFIFLLSRIPKDCHGNSNWICHYGLHWILCQTHPHPHQQHHCVSNPQKYTINNFILLLQVMWKNIDYLNRIQSNTTVHLNECANCRLIIHWFDLVFDQSWVVCLLLTAVVESAALRPNRPSAAWNSVGSWTECGNLYNFFFF